MASSRKPAPADLPARIRAALETRISAGARLCLGLSGGLDSTVLLHLLSRLRAELGFRLAAVHVHHGLSPQADAWAAFCADLCRRLDVPLRVERVRVEAAGHGVEAAARRARYRVYAAQDADWLVLAHQQDDQAETVLLNLLRGAGVAGLAAMPVERPLPGSGLKLLRPLLDIPRAEIAAWAAEHGLVWVEDASNQDGAHARNHLRHAVLPIVERRFPAYRSTLGRAAQHFAECDALLADLAGLDARRAVDERGLDLSALAALGRPRAKNLLRWYLRQLGLQAWPADRLEDFLEQLLAVGADNRLLASAEGLDLRVWQGRLQPVAARPPSAVSEQVWQGEASLGFAGGRLDFQPAVGRGMSQARLEAGPVTLRLRRGGERLQPDCRRPRRALKKLFQEAAIPPWERDGLPMLWVGQDLAWVARLGTDCAYQAAAGEPGVLIAWHPGG